MTLSKNEQTVFYFLFVILVCTVWWTEITLEDLFWFSPLETFLQFLDMIFKKKYFDHILSNYRTEIVLRNEEKIKCWYNSKYVCEKKVEYLLEMPNFDLTLAETKIRRIYQHFQPCRVLTPECRLALVTNSWWMNLDVNEEKYVKKCHKKLLSFTISTY